MQRKRLTGAPTVAELKSEKAAGNESRRAKTVYGRDEFKRLVVGKTQAEVKGMLGDPSKTSEADGETIWQYEAVTVDPANEKTDSSAVLRFKDGKVANIEF